MNIRKLLADFEARITPLADDPKVGLDQYDLIEFFTEAVHAHVKAEQRKKMEDDDGDSIGKCVRDIARHEIDKENYRQLKKDIKRQLKDFKKRFCK